MIHTGFEPLDSDGAPVRGGDAHLELPTYLGGQEEGGGGEGGRGDGERGGSGVERGGEGGEWGWGGRSREKGGGSEGEGVRGLSIDA